MRVGQINRVHCDSADLQESVNLRTGLSSGFVTNRRRTGPDKWFDTTKKTSVHVALILHSVIREDENYIMDHFDKEGPLTLFMNLDSNSNMLSGSVSKG